MCEEKKAEEAKRNQSSATIPYDPNKRAPSNQYPETSNDYQ
jgi:hypothetical protein